MTSIGHLSVIPTANRSITALCSAMLVPILLASLPVHALEPEPDAVFVRIIDTGPGHASVTRMPGGHYMVYDTGHWHQDDLVIEKIKEVIPRAEPIDLLVLSHSDADHIAATDEILSAYTVRMILRTGLEREDNKPTDNTWETAHKAIRQSWRKGTARFNLERHSLVPGTGFSFGEANVQLVSGFYWPQDETDWELKNNSERRNAGSIVVRLTFAGRSILFTGDAVGRHNHDPNDALIATERAMIENSAVAPIDSDVLIAPHHGADNGSSTAFIAAVSPKWVIFPAGHDHHHPKASTARRYLAAGVALDHMLRTDLGDNEGEGDRPGTDTDDEWAHGASAAGDGAGDDDVDLLIRPSGELVVEYRTSQ